jgi:hypothetical protein
MELVPAWMRANYASYEGPTTGNRKATHRKNCPHIEINKGVSCPFLLKLRNLGSINPAGKNTTL